MSGENENFSFCGHERERAYLARLASRGISSRAFLFSGPDGVGKRTAALLFFAGAACEAPRSDERGAFGCGRCATCKSILSGVFPDCMIVAEDEGIGIERIREVKRRFLLHSYASPFRGVLIDNAEGLTREAQSALLKILEEPPPQTVFFLVSSRPQLLLDTVRSRLLEISFHPVSEEMLSAWLAERRAPADRRMAAARLADGRPGYAARLLADAALRESETRRREKFARVMKDDAAGKFLFVDALVSEKDGAADDFLKFCIAALRRKLREPGGGGPEVLAHIHTMLDVYAALETANVNQRLFLDAACIAAGEAI